MFSLITEKHLISYNCSLFGCFFPSVGRWRWSTLCRWKSLVDISFSAHRSILKWKRLVETSSLVQVTLSLGWVITSGLQLFQEHSSVWLHVSSFGWADLQTHPQSKQRHYGNEGWCLQIFPLVSWGQTWQRCQVLLFFSTLHNDTTSLSELLHPTFVQDKLFLAQRDECLGGKRKENFESCQEKIRGEKRVADFKMCCYS